jgi:hypothetical protein
LSRRITTEEVQAVGMAPAELDGYFERIIKYIPADVVGAWLAATALIEGGSDINKELLKWIAFGVGLVLTPPWMLKRTAQPGKSPAVLQAIVAFFAFAIWVFATPGGPFSETDWYHATYGGLLLIAFLLFVGLIIPPADQQGGPAPPGAAPGPAAGS